MPIATPETATGARKPLVYSLDPLHPSAELLAQKHFTLITPSHPSTSPYYPLSSWPEHAEGLLVRGSYVTREELERSGKLRWVAKHGVGVEKIDLEGARGRGVGVMNTPGVNATAVAELALASCMTLARNISSIDRRLRSGEPLTKTIGLTGLTLRSRTLGVIGGGNIGLAVGKMFYAAFGSRVRVFDPFISEAGRKAWGEAIPEEGFLEFVEDLHRDIYPVVDIITLHVPLLPATTNLITAKEFALMKPTAILINTARGGIVNEEDLAEALSRGRIYGAAVDAWVTEPPTREAYPLLMGLDNVVITPHIGAGNADTQRDCSLSTVQHLVDALIHDKPIDRVC